MSKSMETLESWLKPSTFPFCSSKEAEPDQHTSKKKKKKNLNKSKEYANHNI